MHMGTAIYKNLCRNKNLRALPWSGLLNMTRPLQRSSTVPLETWSMMLMMMDNGWTRR